MIIVTTFILLGCYPLKYVCILCVACFFISTVYYKEVSALNRHAAAKIKKSNITIVGQVASLPVYSSGKLHFNFITSQLSGLKHKETLKLLWYKPKYHIDAGSYCKLRIRIISANNVVDSNNFNYKQWLINRGIVAIGYVIKNHSNTCRVKSVTWSWLHQRQLIQRFIVASIKDHHLAAIISALSIGSRALLTKMDWRLFQNSGTSHLIAISGLHVGLIAAVSCAVFMRILSVFERITVRGLNQSIAACMGIVVMLLYGFIAGMSLPTQRAVIMIAVALMSVVLRHFVPRWRRLLLAFLIVILIEPMAVYSASFWLSYFAAGSILYGMYGNHKRSRLLQWLRLQWVITLGLMPLTLYFFHQISLVVFFSNIIAIPWVSLVIVPLCFFATTLYFISQSIAKFFFIITAKLMQPLCWWLRLLVQSDAVIVHYTMPSLLVLMLAITSVVLIFLPRYMPGKWLAIFGFIPICGFFIQLFKALGIVFKLFL